MIYEYIITAFKVIVGVITENRLTIAALIALGVLLIWQFLSLVFSFQGKFASNVKRINEYISRNGIYDGAKSGFEMLVAKMPTEFQRGYKKFERTPNTLPSDHIKRFESLDMELSGGVFNQNKSVLKTFIHFVFVSLLVFSLAVLPVDESLTGYSLAEASIIPLLFFIVAKIMYYVYTAIRQYQYKSAIEEFNSMIENLDRFVIDSKIKPAKPNIIDEISSLTDEEYIKFSGISENLDVQDQAEENEGTSNHEETIINKTMEVIEQNKDAVIENDQNVEEEHLKSETIEVLEEVEEAQVQEKINTEEESITQKEVIEEQKIEVAEEHVDNFKPDFSELLEEEKMENTVKRGRGRPRKEVNPTGEFIITNDKEFEDALVRAEKLMRKNEEPLSASQTKRIEKQIKELVDSMTKYKEGK